MESSINLDLLDNFDKHQNKNNWERESKNTGEENKIEIMNLTQFLQIKDNEIFESKCLNDSSIDRFSLFNLKKYNILVFGGKSKSSDFSTFEFNLDRETWVKLDEIKIQRTDFGLLLLDNRNILILGGKLYCLTQKENLTDSIELIDIQKNTKIKLDVKLKQPKCNFGCLQFEEENSNIITKEKLKIIFVAGGYNGMDVLNHFEFYDFNKKKWFELPNMPVKRKEFGMIFDINGIIYFIGGVDDKEYFKYY